MVNDARTYLIKCADWRQEDDSSTEVDREHRTQVDCGQHVRIIKVGYPRVPLAASTANVVKMPPYVATVNGHIEDVFRNTHSLNPCVEDVL